MGLLDDDKEYIEAIKEASLHGSGYYLRSLFATMLMSNSLSRPDDVWDKSWLYLSYGILFNQHRILKYPDLSLTEAQLKNLTLFEIEQIFLHNNSSLKEFTTMPYPDIDSVFASNNRLISEELAYNVDEEKVEFDRLIVSLTNEQRSIYDDIMSALDGNEGGTTHSRFHIPFVLHEESFCFIQPNIDDAALLSKAKLIIWDEAPMVHKHAIGALDRTLKDVLSFDNPANSLLPFGGKVIVFRGDFRQIPPVVIGPNDGIVDIEIPEDIIISDSNDPIWSLIEFVYPSIVSNSTVPGYFEERAILAPKHELVDEVNERLLALFPGQENEYLSADSICPDEFLKDEVDANLYSSDYLNGIKVSGIPVHKLVLKVGVPIMLLRNIDKKNGLCNGTRLLVKYLGRCFIEVELITGTNVGYRTFIARMSLIPSDMRIPFKFKRKQYPIALCFGMTINKSQGQSLSRVGLFLRQPVFTHGQFYVALSRVKSRKGLKILILDKDGKPTYTTSNVVYKEVFRYLR